MKIKQLAKGHRFDARLLRTIVSRAHVAAKKYEGHLGKRAWRKFIVEIGVARGWGCSGFAYYNCAYMRINIPKKGAPTRRVAAVAYHELMHCYGYKHAAGVDPSAAQLDAICDGLPERIEPVEAKAPAKRDLPAERYGRLLAQERAWQTKAKRAATALKKIRAKLRYYERTLDDERRAAYQPKKRKGG